MSEAAEQLKSALAALSPEDREELLTFLHESLVTESDEEDPELLTKLTRRIEEIRSGQEVGIPAEEVFRRSREKHP
jgi:putative addiction module component (TIGR02574 family)